MALDFYLMFMEISVLNPIATPFRFSSAIPSEINDAISFALL